MLYILFFLTILFFSYILGSINFSILISNVFFKKEIRNYGSGNAGATNMLRTFGKKVALLTFLGDFLKGVVSVYFCWLPAIIFKRFDYDGIRFITKEALIELQMVALIGVVLGHMFPAFYKFKGGKGISTAAGAILNISFTVFLMTILVFIIVILISKMVSLSSICAVLFFSMFNPIYWFMYYNIGELNSINLININFKMWILITIQSILVSFIIIYKHKLNIVRILKGTESKIGK